VPERSVEESADIAASPRAVWDYRFDFVNLPAYNPDVSELVVEGSGVGARYSFQLSTPHGQHPVNLVVDAASFDAGAGYVDASMKGAMSAFERFEVHGEDNQSSASLRLTMQLPDGLNEEQMSQLAEGGRVSIRLELDRMKENLEA
jgi:hypothetical protein